MTDRPRVGISRCLLGDEVRYDGTHRRADAVITTFGREVEWVPVCPEVEVGMGTPREPIQLVAREDGVPSLDERVRLIGVDSGQDWTARMQAWARARVQELKSLNLSGYILKSSSPSCGIDRVRVRHLGRPTAGHYGRTVKVRPACQGKLGPAGQGKLRRGPSRPAKYARTGRGLFAQALIEAMPDLPIEDEERLTDPGVRAAFLKRVQAFRQGQDS